MDNLIEEKLVELEKTANKFWNISKDVGSLLNILVKLHKPDVILELGTSNGYSTIWLAMAAKEIQSKIITMEYFQERINLAEDNFRDCKLDKFIEIRQGKILKNLEKLDTKVDFVFIDACKPEYIDYIKKLELLLSSGALIVADNIESHKQEVKPFVDYIMNNKSYQSVFLSVGTGLILSFKGQ